MFSIYLESVKIPIGRDFGSSCIEVEKHTTNNINRSLKILFMTPEFVHGFVNKGTGISLA